MHIGRSFDGGGHIEASCPCPLEPCGLVDTAKVVDECDQHPPARCKTMRTGHPAESCPEYGRDLVIAIGKAEVARNAILDAAAQGEPTGWMDPSIFDAIDDYREAVEHEAAERIRTHADATAKRGSVGYAGLASAADHIDPEVP